MTRRRSGLSKAIGRTRSTEYRTARELGDVEAILDSVSQRSGRPALRRGLRIIAGRGFGSAMSRWLR